MGVDLRLPNIHGSDREQLVQMRSYLYQLVGELQWALDNVSVGSQSVVVQTRSGATVPSASHSSDIETTFSALKPLIIKSADIVRAYYEEIDSLLKLSGDYVAQSDFGTYKEETALLIKANSTSITQQYSNIQTITTDLGSVKTNLGSVTTNLGTVTTELGAVKNDIGSVTSNLGSVTTELGSVKNELGDLGGEVTSISGTVTTLDGEVSTLDGNLNTSVSSLQGEISAATDKIGEVDEGWKAATEEIEDNLDKTAKDLSGEINTAKEKLSDSIDKASEELKEGIGALSDKVSLVLETTAYIKTGLLYYNEIGAPIYGLEIGQQDEIDTTVFRRFARFTADKLSFYDSNGYEVAYISNQKLYISDVEITASAKLGGFMLDLSKGLRLKWEGREKG